MGGGNGPEEQSAFECKQCAFDSPPPAYHGAITVLLSHTAGIGVCVFSRSECGTSGKMGGLPHLLFWKSSPWGLHWAKTNREKMTYNLSTAKRCSSCFAVIAVTAPC